MNRPTIADLAKAASVSVSTVDRVLNGRDPVRQATAEQVLQAAERIGFYGVGTIRRRLAADKPARSFGFLLQQSHRQLYQMYGSVLTRATAAVSEVRARAVVEYTDDLSPDVIAERLLHLGREVDAVAIVTADQPHVNHAIEVLKADAVPVFALISDLTSPMRAGYVGADNWKMGRTAAWFITSMARQSGKVVVYVGSHRYLCQDICEASFRSYIRERSDGWQMLDTPSTREEPQIAYEITRDLLASEPDLVGLYVAGGGATGVVRALREEDPARAQRLIVVTRDLTGETRAALVDGIINAALTHPAEAMAAALLEAMVQATGDSPPTAVIHQILPFEIFTPENI